MTFHKQNIKLFPLSRNLEDEGKKLLKDKPWACTISVFYYLFCNLLEISKVYKKKTHII